MFKSVLFLLLASATLLANATEEGFSFSPKGFFVIDTDDIQFKAKSWSPDYELKLQPDSAVIFSGPIFPGYKLAKQGDIDVRVPQQSVCTTQRSEEFEAQIQKTFTLVNGAILSTISYKSAKELSGEPVRYRILLPVNIFAGTEASCGNTKVSLPKEIGKSYILHQGKKAEEFRFRIDSSKELGLKFLSGVMNYYVADCRHHKIPEQQFHIYIDMKGDSLSYLLCILKPGAPFPSTTPDAQSDIDITKKSNLLGAGAGFEIGPHGFNPICYYSWSEAWTSAGTFPVFDISTSHQGKYSMRLTADDLNMKRGRFNMNGVEFRPVKLNAAKTYTLSVWMKSDRENMKACIQCAENVWDGTSGKTVTVSKDWTKYSYTFKPEKFQILNFCRAWVGVHPSNSSGTLWIDDVQLTEGEVGESAVEPLEFGASIDSRHKLFTTEELKSASVKLLFRNNSPADISCSVSYEFRDFWDKVVAKGKSSVTIPAKANANSELKLPNLPFGYYKATFVTDDGKHRDEAIFGVYKPMNYEGLLPKNWPLGCDASEGSPIVRRLGFGWTRSWDFTFKRVCPEKDKLNFAETDIIVERCRKDKLNIMPILGFGFGRASYDKDGNACIPAWAIEHTSKSSVKNSWALDVAFPTQDAWKLYVKTIVSRYKDYIKVWEVLNEPNCWLTPEEYAPYLRSTYEAAKEADPTCTIVGIGATSDWGGEPAPWTSKVMELDKCRSMDAVSIHMYSDNMPERASGNGTDKILTYLKDEMRKYGRDIPIWHTEKSHTTTKLGYSVKGGRKVRQWAVQ